MMVAASLCIASFSRLNAAISSLRRCMTSPFTLLCRSTRSISSVNSRFSSRVNRSFSLACVSICATSLVLRLIFS